MIEDKGTGLYGLVNNAGVGGGGVVLETPVENQTFVYTVNVEGVYRTTKAFAPLVIESKGRIVTTGSIAGTISAFPGFGVTWLSLTRKNRRSPFAPRSTSSYSSTSGALTATAAIS